MVADLAVRLQMGWSVEMSNGSVLTLLAPVAVSSTDLSIAIPDLPRPQQNRSRLSLDCRSAFWSTRTAICWHQER